MKVTMAGRQRDLETGEPVDLVELVESTYEKVMIKRMDEGTVIIHTEREGGSEESFKFKLKDEPYVGIEPMDVDFGAISDELRAILNFVGYTEAVPSDMIVEG